MSSKRAVMLSPGRADLRDLFVAAHERLASMFESLGQAQKAQRQRAQALSLTTK